MVVRGRQDDLYVSVCHVVFHFGEYYVVQTIYPSRPHALWRAQVPSSYSPLSGSSLEMGVPAHVRPSGLSGREYHLAYTMGAQGCR